MAIKVGITGQSGFMGQHLFNYLGHKATQIERVEFQRSYFEDTKKLEAFVSSCDVIVHIAAMNRHKYQQIIYDTNISLVQKLIDACKETGTVPKIVFSSSTQEDSNNLYGQSKRDGRKLLEDWANEYGGKVTSLVIPNVFGPFGKPNYNSFISTFSYELIEGRSPEVIEDNVVNLIYINELTEFIFQEVINKSNQDVDCIAIPHTSSKKVSEILSLLEEFKLSYVDNGRIPTVPEGSFELDLFNTFTSYLPEDYFPKKFMKHQDNRGAFVEIMRADVSGQTSYSTTIPGITRGNHYHTRKIERFAVISGKASIKLRRVGSDDVIEYILDGENPAYVDMPIWYTHNITNIGDADLITLFWINEPYNPEDADTYFLEV